MSAERSLTVDKTTGSESGSIPEQAAFEADLLRVLSGHQIVSRGLTFGTPDECLCGSRVAPDHDQSVEISLRRHRAFARHQAEAILADADRPARGE